MLVRWRNELSRRADGRVSSVAIVAGTFQYGLKTTCVSVSMKIGVGVSFFPTTTRMDSATVSRSHTSSRNAGMFTRMCLAVGSRGIQRHRSMFSSICLMRSASDTPSVPSADCPLSARLR